MSSDLDRIVKDNLAFIHTEMVAQDEMAKYYGRDSLSFSEEMEQIREYIHDAKEFGLAYEVLVVNAEQVPFKLSSRAAVKLLEVGLIMGFKTERAEDDIFRAKR